MLQRSYSNIRPDIQSLVSRYPILAGIQCDILAVVEKLTECLSRGGKLMLAGNGGSCSDCEHIVGELMKGFLKKRPVPSDFKDKLTDIDEDKGKILSENLQGALPAITLSSNLSLNTAFLNDVGGDYTFAQQVYGYGKAGDVLIGISTSGNAENVIYAAIAAKAMGISVIGLTGKTGGALKKYADISIIAPASETFMIQELHLPIYHFICKSLEERFFNM